MKASAGTLRSPLILGALFGQWLIATLFLLFVLENEVVARTFISGPAWEFWLTRLGGTLQRTSDGLIATASLAGLGILSLFICLFMTATAAAVAVRRNALEPASKTEQAKNRQRGVPPAATWTDAVQQKCFANVGWSIPLAVWGAGWMISLAFPGSGLAMLLIQTARMAAAATLSGWLWELSREWFASTRTFSVQYEDLRSRSAMTVVLSGMALYVVVFTAMNWGLWFNLQLPHGDSSMYEEHLWNVLHGKGFRSYLDQGLFLGEHIQVVHLLLLPLYLLWPSHLFMELAESAGLALAAIPVYSIAKRHGGSERAAVLVALAYLFYFPMHYLDIAIDLKTFRPTAFGIPALLFMIDMAERRRWGWLSLCAAISLSCQEDFGLAVGTYGAWLLVDAWWKSRTQPAESRRDQLIAGLVLFLLGPAYTVLAVKYFIPWFRSGVTVHYASYFQAFGKTPVEIVINILTNPWLLLKHLVTVASVVLFLDLLQPLGMPLRAWRQLLVGLPLFVLLSLNELTHDFPGPYHHFHAPLIPTLIWGACCSLGYASSKAPLTSSIADRRGLWILCSSVMMAVFFSLSPAGIAFWDGGGPFYWSRLYVPGERASEFSKVIAAIPLTARVASTDFVHSRFTHYTRSYDYSHYPRRVANYEDKVPDDTDYIVIDTGHRYSEIQRYEQTREYLNQRDQWEQLPIDTKGYFIVLKRVKYPEPHPPGQPAGNSISPADSSGQKQ